MMNKETYERLYMDVTSDEAYDPDEFEMTGTGATNGLTFPGA